MEIESYISQLGGNGKRPVLLIVTPKNEYPKYLSDERYNNFEKAILKNPKSYTYIFEENEKEIMQYVGFRYFLKPAICEYHNGLAENLKKLNEKDVINFFIAKHFFATVPFGEKSEEEAIKYGKELGGKFIDKFPINKFEYTSTFFVKDSEQYNMLMKLDFNNQNINYYFDYVYIH